MNILIERFEMKYWVLMGAPEAGCWVAGKYNTFKEAVKHSRFARRDGSWSRDSEKKWAWKKDRWWGEWIEIVKTLP